MFMPDICFMICSLLSASWTLMFGFSFMITVRLNPWGSPPTSSSLEPRRFFFRPASSGFASGYADFRDRRRDRSRDRDRRRRPRDSDRSRRRDDEPILIAEAVRARFKKIGCLFLRLWQF